GESSTFLDVGHAIHRDHRTSGTPGQRSAAAVNPKAGYAAGVASPQTPRVSPTHGKIHDLNDPMAANREGLADLCVLPAQYLTHTDNMDGTKDR
ncbi:unnamed protein product, partial [Amoebophrya sp. A25]